MPGPQADNGLGFPAHGNGQRHHRHSQPGSGSAAEPGCDELPTWGCGVSTFPWTYDEQETCFLLEGDVTVTPDGGEPVRFGVGDLVVFDQGLSCTWDVHAPVRKHYRFG